MGSITYGRFGVIENFKTVQIYYVDRWRRYRGGPSDMG